MPRVGWPHPYGGVVTGSRARRRARRGAARPRRVGTGCARVPCRNSTAESFPRAKLVHTLLRHAQDRGGLDLADRRQARRATSCATAARASPTHPATSGFAERATRSTPPASDRLRAAPPHIAMREPPRHVIHEGATPAFFAEVDGPIPRASNRSRIRPGQLACRDRQRRRASKHARAGRRRNRAQRPGDAVVLRDRHLDLVRQRRRVSIAAAGPARVAFVGVPGQIDVVGGVDGDRREVTEQRGVRDRVRRELLVAAVPGCEPDRLDVAVCVSGDAVVRLPIRARPTPGRLAATDNLRLRVVLVHGSTAIPQGQSSGDDDEMSG
jgi:hypothetical protein